ncbi:hypothetical protein CROQUDRAFT_133922 [Cronartium quercuum f. sp. fusiforme G11]|uniref:Uncharacterized protein n=1 Tax=Cronartium quercuum f. sp. fusiforme G11 TaxID=708437 RepID=A0A9P6NJ43_9BASI|nr:hypothetical protein CROQUDRAFT_133922 [Cronartium quercuum f. sp. fusiforme G11]
MHPSSVLLTLMCTSLIWILDYSRVWPRVQPNRFRETSRLSEPFQDNTFTIPGLISTEASRPHPYLSKSTVVDHQAYAEHQELSKGSGKVEYVTRGRGDEEESTGEEAVLVKENNKGLFDIEFDLNGYAVSKRPYPMFIIPHQIEPPFFLQTTQALQEKYVRPQPFRRHSIK